jgi:hypothetical protein
MRKFTEWMAQNRTLGTDEVDSQIDRFYDKAKYAIKIVQIYVKSSPDPKKRNLLKNISTIAPIGSNVYGLYNSGENKAVIGKPTANTTRFKFGASELGNADDIQKLPVSVIRKYIPDIPPDQIKPSDVIHVNVQNIVSKLGDTADAVLEIASTIVHEATHNMEYRSSQSAKPSLGETNPKNAEVQFMSWAKDNWNSILSAIPQLRTVQFRNR